MSKLQKRINDWAQTALPKIPKSKIKKASYALSNAACHFNAVAAVNGKRADSVWLVWAGGEKGVIHFISSKAGKFFDETWSHQDDEDYRIIRKIEEHEHDRVYQILCASKRWLISQHGTLYDKYKLWRGQIHGTI